MGMSLDEVILRSTWNPAKEIQHESWATCPSVDADVAVLRLEKGKFGFIRQIGDAWTAARNCIANDVARGKVVYDLNGLTAVPWEKAQPPAPRKTEIGFRRHFKTLLQNDSFRELQGSRPDRGEVMVPNVAGV